MFFRHPRTAQERRAAAGLVADAVEMTAVGINIRPRRNASGETLPSEYDDVVSARRFDRNWKKFRRHQCVQRDNKTRHQKVDGGHYLAHDLQKS